MNAADTTRLAGDAYSTRLARAVPSTSDDKTRLAQEGYESRLARDAVGVQPEADEFYKIGDKIGDRYEVAVIHHGAMGVVYGCFDHETKLPRALKTVRARYASDRQVLSMFESEATVWISLEKHPYIVRAYLVERFKNLPYVITEYVRGPEGMEGDLRGWLGHPRLTLPVAVAMALQIAQGMQHAVRKVPNLVHRDLKPANILVNGDGKAMVTDFGLVQAAESGAGTPAYMSPEQWRDEALDARSDIYAYGCILFEMFAARRLFPALTEHDWKRAHLQAPPAALTNLVPDLPSEIDQFVRCCLAKDAGARPQNWEEVVTFFAQWYHRLTGKAVVLDFSSLALNAAEWLIASYSLSNLNRYEESLLACARALAIDPSVAAVWSNKGGALHALGRHEESIEAYDKALALEPNDSATLYNKGIALGDLLLYQEAISAYDAALSINQNVFAAWTNRGVALGLLGRYQEANHSFDRALKINKDDAVAWRWKAGALSALDRHEEAIGAYDCALVIDPNDATTWYKKGDLLCDLQCYEEAIQAYDRVLKITPNDSTVWRWKGVALRDLNCYEESIRAYDEALALDPNDSVAWCDKGDSLCDLKRYEEAIYAYDRVLLINPNDFVAWQFKGMALWNLQRYIEAIQAYDHALIFDPNDAAVWNFKGLALGDLKRYEEAIYAYGKALAINPNDEFALRERQLATGALKGTG